MFESCPSYSIYVQKYMSLSDSLKEFKFCYIKQIWCGISINGFYLKSSSFRVTEDHSAILLKGPKGIGKSSALVGMLANYSLGEIPAILLTQDFFKQPQSTLDKVAEWYNLGKNMHVSYDTDQWIWKGTVWKKCRLFGLWLCQYLLWY